MSAHLQAKHDGIRRALEHHERQGRVGRLRWWGELGRERWSVHVDGMDTFELTTAQAYAFCLGLRAGELAAERTERKLEDGIAKMVETGRGVRAAVFADHAFADDAEYMEALSAEVDW